MANPEPATAGAPRWVRAVLAVPLMGKLAGANAVIVIAAFIVASVTAPPAAGGLATIYVVTGALLFSFAINVALVALALRPLRQIEATVQRVWAGDFAARVPESWLADRNMDRIGRTLNVLLESLTNDRDRMRRLARQVITASDSERASISRTLHDSAAQSLAALAFQASAAAHEGRDSPLAERLQTIKDLATGILDEVRVLGQTLYPQVLDDLGLPSALRSVAREIEERSPSVNVRVEVADPDAAAAIPADVASVLYHIAREGVANALRHGSPQDIDVRVDVADDTAHLTVADNGRGFDVTNAEREAAGTGLFGMRERLALLHGELNILSRAGEGTRIVVSVPLNQARAV